MSHYHKSRASWTDAEPLYTRALAITEKALGPDHPDTAAQLNNLAGLYQYTGRLAEAEPLYERASAITEKALGPDHPDTATPLNNLAGLYQDTGRLAEAEPLYRRTVAILEKLLPIVHPKCGGGPHEPQPRSAPNGTAPALAQGLPEPRELRRHRRPTARRRDKQAPPE